MAKWRWEAVAEIVRPLKPRLGAEIGVKKGHFTEHLLQHYPDLRMLTVDPWEIQPEGNETYQEWGMHGVYQEYKDRMRPFGDRAVEIREYSHRAASLIEDGSLDFVFIDAQHDYVSVCDDIDSWMPKVRAGGILSGHDYDEKFPGVIQAVDERFDANLAPNAVWWVKC